MTPYRVTVNLELTSKCNAACVMCPRKAIVRPEAMKKEVFETILGRLDEKDVFRVVIAGYGEPTTHPLFAEFMGRLSGHPVRFDMVTNGQLLDAALLEQLDGTLDTMIISLSSIDPDIYSSVHVNLDLGRVMENIILAQRMFKRTKLAVSLTPLPECLETLPQTIEWLRGHGVEALTMSPTLYNRGGSLQNRITETGRLREIIAAYGLQSQEMDFIPSVRDIVLQCWKNAFRCLPRNSDVLISASGDYLYCYNDISHQHVIGNVKELKIRDALEIRERLPPIRELCGKCNMRKRYGTGEVVRVALQYAVRGLQL